MARGAEIMIPDPVVVGVVGVAAGRMKAAVVAATTINRLDHRTAGAAASAAAIIPIIKIRIGAVAADGLGAVGPCPKIRCVPARLSARMARKSLAL
jgi:hypothetical protein